LKDLRLTKWIGFQPTSIEVETCEISSVISQKYSIDVDHGKDENIKFPQQKLHFF